MIGFGGIGASHKAAYDILEREGAKVRLVAICDKNKDSIGAVKRTNLGEIAVGALRGISLYSDVDKMLEREEFELADICLPTFLHKEYTLKLLRAGKHVLCEKPMALSSEDCIEMVKTAKEEKRELMVGQCLRFDPAYEYLKGLVDSGELGRARRVKMGRLSFMPAWGGWFTDVKKSGGVITDFHIHDIDILRYIFGEPRAVSAVSYPEGSGYQYVSTRFFYEGMIAEAEASFDEAASAPFEMRYRVRFDKASVCYDGDRVTVYPDGGEPYEPRLPSVDRIAEEIRYFSEVISEGKENDRNPADSAARSIRLAELIRESAASGGEIRETGL